jgi:hypothetical protein
MSNVRQHMSTALVEFDVPFTAELIDDAATSFVRQYLFKRYGRWLMLACVINAIGFALAVWLGGNEPLVIAWLGVVALVGPAYLIFAYFFYPARFATRLKPRFLPTAHFSLSSEVFGIRTQAGIASLPWSRVKSVLHFPSYFILVLSPFAFCVLPKVGLPSEACEILLQRNARVA